MSLVLLIEIPAQSTFVGVKVGINGNYSSTLKSKSGDRSEHERFGNGYQGGAYAGIRLFKGLNFNAEFAYVNSTFEMDHTSFTKYDSRASEHLLYEELVINHTAFNFSTGITIDLKYIQLGVNPEISVLAQSNGYGTRFQSDEGHSMISGKRVQYRFFSKRRQVYNRANPEEDNAFTVNRLLYGMDVHLNFLVHSPFYIQAKAFYPFTAFVEEVVGFSNESIHQKSINFQISTIYHVSFKNGHKINAERKVKKRIK